VVDDDESKWVAIDAELFSVALIRVLASGKAPSPTVVGSATGFFYEDQGRTYLVTNRHVVIKEDANIYPDTIQLIVHTSREDIYACRDVPIPLYDGKTKPVWLEHPKSRSKVDVVALDFTQHRKESDVIVPWRSDKLLKPGIVLKAGEKLSVIGYPLGFYDTVFNLPVVRDAAIASAYPMPFRGRPFFLIDANLHPGTSGGPVVTKSSGIRHTKAGGTEIGPVQVSLLGVNAGEYIQDGVSLGLHQVWYAKIIEEIISGTKRS
jgi:S1-C subfamily serine protease